MAMFILRYNKNLIIELVLLSVPHISGNTGYYNTNIYWPCRLVANYYWYNSSCDLSAKPAPKGTLRYIHSITGPVPALSKTDRPGVSAGKLPAQDAPSET